MASFSYTICRKDIKNIKLKVNQFSEVVVTAPLSCTDEEISRVVAKKSKWILEKLKYFNSMSEISLRNNEILLFGKRYTYFYNPMYKRKVVVNHRSNTINTSLNLLEEAQLNKWLRKYASRYLRQRISELSDIMHLLPNRIYIRSMKNDWGTCSKWNNLCLNWKLILAPKSVSDYIIVHELLHIEFKNHSGQFLTMLIKYCPDYQSSRDWLEKYGNNL